MSDTPNNHDQEHKSGEHTRRDFLRKAGLIGAGAILGGFALNAGFNFEAKKGKKFKKKVLTEEGKLIEVELSPEDLQNSKPEFEQNQERGREGIKGKRFVMVIDLAKCRNARKCVSACQGAHELRPHQYHINTLLMQDTPDTAPYYMPKPCQHCDNPPCVSVCPVDATYKRQDGIVLIDNERCIGCRFCMSACPYNARIFNWEEPFIGENDPKTGLSRTYNVELNTPQKKGTVSKCLFSADRLRENELPYCVSACPNGVFYFGDQNEDAVTNGTTKETVRLSSLLKDKGGYTLMPELGTKPRVYYLPPKDRLFDVPEDAAENLNHHES